MKYSEKIEFSDSLSVARHSREKQKGLDGYMKKKVAGSRLLVADDPPCTSDEDVKKVVFKISSTSDFFPSPRGVS